MEEIFRQLQERIGYIFRDSSLLERALTHSSYSNEKNLSKAHCNERLEFLGDAVLELIVSEYIYNKFPEKPEGDMTKLRALSVCEQSLSERARSLAIGDCLLLGKGEASTGGRTRDSILADAFESVLGAVYLDGGFDAAKKYAIPLLKETIKKDDVKQFDFKTQLQEVIQSQSKEPLGYQLIDESGPDHDKTFVSAVVHKGETLGKGEGRTKKEAEQQAAKQALEKLTIK